MLPEKIEGEGESEPSPKRTHFGDRGEGVVSGVLTRLFWFASNRSNSSPFLMSRTSSAFACCPDLCQLPSRKTFRTILVVEKKD